MQIWCFSGTVLLLINCTRLSSSSFQIQLRPTWVGPFWNFFQHCPAPSRFANRLAQKCLYLLIIAIINRWSNKCAVAAAGELECHGTPTKRELKSTCYHVQSPNGKPQIPNRVELSRCWWKSPIGWCKIIQQETLSNLRSHQVHTELQEVIWGWVPAALDLLPAPSGPPLDWKDLWSGKRFIVFYSLTQLWPSTD